MSEVQNSLQQEPPKSRVKERILERQRLNNNQVTRKNRKPIPLCQCEDPVTHKGCEQPAITGSLFCENHQDCPKPPLSGYEPVYQPDTWNMDPALIKSHNCYNWFAQSVDKKAVEQCRKNNLKDCRQYFAQPGGLHGDRNALNAEKRRVCPILEKLIMKDIPDMTKTTFYERCPAGTSKGAMVNHKHVDFHFYLQNKKTGLWSHKDGSNQVKDFDSLGRKIFHPGQSVRDYRWKGSNLNYDDFCGFYCVPRRPIVLGQGGFVSRRQQELKTAKHQLRGSSQIFRKTMKARKARTTRKAGKASKAGKANQTRRYRF